MSKRGVACVSAAVVLLSATMAWASGSMQKAPSGQMQKAPALEKKTLGTLPAIKVEAQSLTAAPAQPQAGQQVTVTFVFKNTGPGTAAKVPWSIHLATGNQTLAQGEKANLEPGASFTATAQWTATAGQKLLQGYVDPTGKAFKNTAPVSAQIKELTLTVAPVATAALVERVLDYQKAKAVGARFADNREQAGCIVTDNYFMAGAPTNPTAGFVFDIDCRGSITGEKKNPEAFASFSLKNGWKVKRVEVNETARTNAEWSWVTRPNPGSTDPRLRMHLWAEPLGRVSVNVKVYIEGPEGANAYE